jgi:hypothetical protein
VGERRPRGRAGLDKQIQAARKEREQLKRERLVTTKIIELAQREAVLEAIGTCRSVTALMSHSGSVATMGFFHNLIVHAL